MLFSVVIPTYNRAALLAQTLESVWSQTFADYEVIVVDDGSTDNTESVVRRFGGRLQSLRKKNAGPGSARNFGIEKAAGEYLAFLDSDDVWFPWSLATYASLIRLHGHPAFIAGKPLRFENDEALAGGLAGTVTSERFADYFVSGDQWRWWGVSSFVVRSDVLRACGGFLEANINGEDGDLAMKLGAAAGFVQVTSPYTFGYREHGSNVTADLSKSLAGVWHKIRAEQAGTYPGGAARALERRRILTRHVRPVALECLRRGMRKEARELYQATFAWHARLGRWKFLAAFPALDAMAALRRLQTS